VETAVSLKKLFFVQRRAFMSRAVFKPMIPDGTNHVTIWLVIENFAGGICKFGNSIFFSGFVSVCSAITHVDLTGGAES
jgi:hypothetical protein